MFAVAVAVLLCAAPVKGPKAPPGLSGGWYDHGTLSLVLWPDGVGQLGANVVKWDVEGKTLVITSPDDTQKMPFELLKGGKGLELTTPSTKIDLDKGKLPQSPAEKEKLEKAKKDKEEKAEKAKKDKEEKAEKLKQAKEGKAAAKKKGTAAPADQDESGSQTE